MLGTYVVRDARNLVRPNLLLLQWMVRVALGQKVLEEPHVLQAKEGDLVVRLVGDLGQGGIFTFEARLDAVAARWMRLLALARGLADCC